MKKAIQTFAAASITLLSAAAFAGNAPTTGGGGQGTGATTSAATFGAAVSAVAGQGQGVSISRSPSGAIVISPKGGSGAPGGVTFAPTTITVGNQSFTVSANGGSITLTPVAE